MKYIILQGNIPLIFPDYVGHKDVAAGKQVLSAGFCSIETYRKEFDDIRAKCSSWVDRTL